MIDFKLTPIEQNGQRVLTTAQLAEAYGTDIQIITNNFNRNKDRYTEGKHYYCLTGNELKAFFAKINLSFANSNKIRTLYLWTERGSLLHAKSLNTDTAWEAYDYLLEYYFRTRELSILNAELLEMLRSEIKSDIEETVNKALNKKMEEVVNKVFDERMSSVYEIIDKTVNSINKSADSRTNSVAKKIIRVVNGNIKLLAIYIDYLIKRK